MVEQEAGREEPWFSSASVEARVLHYLQQNEGCAILSSGQPGALGPGVELVAQCDSGAGGVQRIVSVIGWPNTGADEAPAPEQRPEIIARGWLANALLDLALSRDADADISLSLALPAIASYVRYLQRLRWLLGSADISIYLVSQDGRVGLLTPASPARQNGNQPGYTSSGARRRLGLPGATRLHLPLLHVLSEAGGAASRTDVIAGVARLFPSVPDPPPAEFGQRLSVAQTQLQSAGLTRLLSRGIWQITDTGRARYQAEWHSWRGEGRAAQSIN